MAILKNELYKTLWESCNALRGGMDASQYKDYVLVLLAIKYVTDRAKVDKRFKAKVGALSKENKNNFDALIALKGNIKIGEEMNHVIANFSEAITLKGAFQTADFNDETKLGSGKSKVNRLTKLIGLFEEKNLDFSGAQTGANDILGDAYEYFMKQFAKQSGKSKGQFYTPSEVSRLMAKLLNLRKAERNDTVYDPTCGSGSLLLRAAEETPKGITIYGQEKELATSTLAKLNLIVHDYLDDASKIAQEDTLSNPLHLDETKEVLKKFKFIVANPPFSLKGWQAGHTPEADKYGRFKWGPLPENNGDYAFLLHIIASLRSDGEAAVILPHGVLFRSGKEYAIRKILLQKGYIKAVIGLPPKLFYGTGIPACIVVIDKNDADERNKVFMIQAEKGFIKDSNSMNKLRERDIHKIVDTFRNEKTEAHYARWVSLEEISDPTHDFNLNIPRYISPIDEEDEHDLLAHLQGGIPAYDMEALQMYWANLPQLKEALVSPHQREGYYALKVAVDDIDETIKGHPATAQYLQRIEKSFQMWYDEVLPTLKGLDKCKSPKKAIEALGEECLKKFEGLPLVDPYAIYQFLMDYGHESLESDIYNVATEGWKLPVQIFTKNKKATWDCELFPKALLSPYLFAQEVEALESLKEEITAKKATQEALVAQCDEKEDDNPFLEVLTTQGKVDSKKLESYLKKATKAKLTSPPYKILQAYQAENDAIAQLKKREQATTKALDEKLGKCYRSFTHEEVQHFLIHYKWLPHFKSKIEAHAIEKLQWLTHRLELLEARYGKSLGTIEKDLEESEKKVKAIFAHMGFSL